MTVTLIDFGAWYRPYGLQTDAPEGTPRSMARPLRRAHWRQSGDTWYKDDDFLVCNPLGFAICSNINVLPFDIMAVGDWSHCSGVGYHIRAFIVPDDWGRYVAPVLEANACRTFQGWCERRLVGGMAADTRRLVLRCQRIGMAYPSRNTESSRLIDRRMQRMAGILCEASTVEYRSSFIATAIDALSILLPSVGAVVAGISRTGGNGIALAGVMILSGVILRILSDRFVRTDTTT